MTLASLTERRRRSGTLICRSALAVGFLLLPVASPAQTAVLLGRIWGAAGDSAAAAPGRITLETSHLELSGSGAKLADDTGLVDGWRVLTRFDYSRQLAGERRLTLRGRLSSDDRMPGSFELESARPGLLRCRVFYHRSTHYDDPTAGDPYRPDRTVRQLQGDPLMRWAAAGCDWSRRLDAGWRLRAGYEHIGQEGTRASLGRGLSAVPYVFGAPDALSRNILTHRAWFGGARHGARLALDWNAEFQSDGGERASATSYRTESTSFAQSHTWQDERRTWNLRAGASWELGPRVVLFGSYGYLGRFSRPREVLTETPLVSASADAAADEVAINARSHAGAATLVWRPWAGARLRLGARVQRLDLTGVSTLERDGQPERDTRNSHERQRTRQVYSVGFQHAGGHGTVLTTDWEHKRTDETSRTISLDEYAGGSLLLRAQAGDRVRTTDALALRLRRRLAARLHAGARLEYRHEDVNECPAVLFDQYAQGDRTWERLRAEVSARARLGRNGQLDAGGELIDEDFTRRDLAATRSDWNARRLFAVGSWAPWKRLSLLGSFAWGVEDYGLAGPLPPEASNGAVASPAEYKGTTYRLSPGVVVTPTAGWQAEGHYERVRNRDAVANDSDRWYGRITATLADRWDVSATYRRYAFTAGYDDDYTADLYGLAVTTRF